MSMENASGAPLVAAVIVLAAILALGGIAWSFQGSIQF